MNNLPSLTTVSRVVVVGVMVATLALDACADATSASQCAVSDSDLIRITPVEEKLANAATALLGFKKEVEARTAELGPTHPRVAEALFEHGRVLTEIGHLAEARTSLERALVIQQQNFRDFDHRVVRTKQTLGIVLRVAPTF